MAGDVHWWHVENYSIIVDFVVWMWLDILWSGSLDYLNFSV
jgi:hypothetical protein